MARLLVIPFIFYSVLSFSQDVIVRGEFQQDSIKIGTILPYTLSALYPRSETVIFPDSTYSFAPFEYDHKVYFSTISSDELSYDSVVYYLSSFEIDTVQRLSLPVFFVHARDCTAVYPAMDSVFLQHLVEAVPDSVSIEQLPLKTNTTYLDVSWLLNYPLILVACGILLVLAFVGWLLFGKRIRKYFKLRRLNRQHRKFIQEFSNAIDYLQTNYSTAKAESALLIWKQYMERLLSRPITKFTSKEIHSFLKNESLDGALKNIDTSIYGKKWDLSKEPLDVLQRFSEEKFHEKVETIKNG